MRSIGKISSQQEALRFSAYLRHLRIAHTCEASAEPSTEYVSYEVWVHDEDRIDEARQAFELFSKNPSDPLFNLPVAEVPPLEEETTPLEPEPAPEPAPLQRKPSFLTYLAMIFCALTFVMNSYQEIPFIREGIPGTAFIFTPIQATCLYDLPPFFEKLAALLQDYAKSNPSQLAQETQKDLQDLPQAVYWRGAYDWLLLKLQGVDPSSAEGPLWIKIRQGELWRLFSPSILHGGLLHILFNMIWVWLLCRPIEQRIGFLRTLFLTIAIGIGSNTAQYLMGGPFFLGYSGIVMGLAGFIWSRQRIAPWEGYPIQRSTLLFLLFFVLAMFALQSVSFILQVFSDVEFSPNIANTAHIVGALFGAVLGRSRRFAWRIAR